MAHHKKLPKAGYKSTKEKLLERKKERKLKLKEKRARLILKNLPFKTTEESLKEHFQQFGEISSVELLKRPDGKLVGCGFIQFKLVQKAAKARFHTNGKPFLGREIQVDFALSKNKYQEKDSNKKLSLENEAKETVNNEDSSIVEKNNTDEDTNENINNPLDIEIKSESEDSNSSSSNKHSVDDDEDDSTDMKSESEDASSENDDACSENKDNDGEKDIVHKPFRSNDIVEGKTIFVKNIPFAATNENLRECMSKFGPIYYALICIDKFTEHSKGTGFVKFRNKEDADKALNAGTELTLLGNILDCHSALNREDLTEKFSKNKKQENKDSRSLYLVKEGVILAGSKAAEGVSASDMAKRLMIEQYKTQMLRNLNMFVSRERLVIHNLPPNWDDKKLRILVQKYAGADAVIREARVMRDMRNLDANGVGKSKEFGFVTFSKHENALQCLRALNNNPNIFTPIKRPIVTFSIENKSVIKIRQKRLEKSKQKNPLSKSFDKMLVDKEVSKKHNLEDVNVNEFSGVSATPGIKKMRSKFNLKTQAKLHHENLKNEKRKRKLTKLTFLEKKKEFRKQPKQKINKKQEKDDFSKLVNRYKSTLLNNEAQKKRKWYE